MAMQTITKDELMLNKDMYIAKILKGATIIYPTDTIYAIGSSAKLADSVKRVRDAKQRPNQPFSVIAPSKEWIYQNCEVNEKVEEWLEKLPGPYTLILKRKKLDCVAENVNPVDDTLGIRMPNHWFAEIIEEIGVPMITPSANVTGTDFMTGIDNLQSEIKNNADLMIDDGVLNGTPSTLVNLTKEDEEITSREK